MPLPVSVIIMLVTMMMILNFHIVHLWLYYSLCCAFSILYTHFSQRDTSLIHFPENEFICYYTAHTERNYIFSSTKKWKMGF